MSEQLVYVIGHREMESRIQTPMLKSDPYVAPPDYHKIGVAKDVEKRLRELSGGTPHELEIVTTVESDEPKDVEKRLHQLNYDTKQNGEWFFLPDEFVESIKELDRLNLEELKWVQYENDYHPVDENSFFDLVMQHRNEVSMNA